MDKYVLHEELQHVSIDATIRILRRVRGQADYRASASVRNSAPIPDDEAKRRVLTVLGRSSSVIVSTTVKDEAAPNLAGALLASLSLKEREQITTVRSDAPGAILLAGLREVVDVSGWLLMELCLIQQNTFSHS